MSAVAPKSRLDEPRGKRATFPRSGRLLRHSDFERVYKQGRRHFGVHLTVFYLRRAEGNGPRVGFTVGRVLGGAVERNRIKRRLREAVRMHRANLLAAVDVVINPKKSVLKIEFCEVGSEIGRAFEVIQRSIPANAT
ncbi:MAG: ribonuclease P protein component [Terriglobales bacterium]